MLKADEYMISTVIKALPANSRLSFSAINVEERDLVTYDAPEKVVTRIKFMPVDTLPIRLFEVRKTTIHLLRIHKSVLSSPESNMEQTNCKCTPGPE